MSFLRPSLTLRAALLRPVVSTVSRPAMPTASQRFASGDYGSGEGDPAGENPQKQPASKASDLEHPGPPPPDVGKGTGTTPTKATSKGHETGETQQSSPSSSSDQSSKPKDHSVKGAQPKILDANPPAEHSEDVKRHNRELEQRAERADTKISNEDAEKDKVAPGYWSGRGGADRSA